MSRNSTHRGPRCVVVLRTLSCKSICYPRSDCTVTLVLCILILPPVSSLFNGPFYLIFLPSSSGFFHCLTDFKMGQNLNQKTSAKTVMSLLSPSFRFENYLAASIGSHPILDQWAMFLSHSNFLKSQTQI